MLDLREIRHSRIGDENTRGISGGQRKRVNIGLEMVAEPSVLFLDEPTSGLDSTSSLDVCKALRDIADTGITVITVINQPVFLNEGAFIYINALARASYLNTAQRDISLL